MKGRSARHGEPPISGREIRVFAARIALLLLLLGAIYWLGWLSPWARAGPEVVVQMPDAPKPALPIAPEAAASGSAAPPADERATGARDAAPRPSRPSRAELRELEVP